MNIESAEDIPGINDSVEFNEKLEQVRRIRADGDSWYDACLEVGSNEVQRSVLAKYMLHEVKAEREQNEDNEKSE